MSRRNTYLLGGLAIVVGVVLVIVAIAGVGGGDDSTTTTPTQTENPIRPGSEPPSGAPTPPPASGTNGRGGAIRQNLARRRTVRAPDFTADVIHEGTLPERLRGPFGEAADGGLDLSSLRGTPVVLHLWSSQCAPCRTDARLVEATWKRWGPRGVLFVGASVNEPSARAEEVVRQFKLTYPAVSDPGGQIPRLYGATALPQTYFISAEGDIVGEVSGSPSVRQLELGAEAATSGEPFGSEQGTSRVPLR